MNQKKEKFGKKAKSNRNDHTKAKLVIFFVPIIIIILIVFLKIILDPLYLPYINFISEDGPVEYATVIVYILTSGLSLLSAKIFFKNQQKKFGILYLGMMIIFIFIAIEEVSWGQRILNLDLPEIFKESTQGEINIHDLPPFSFIEDATFVFAGFLGVCCGLFLQQRKILNSFRLRDFLYLDGI